MDWNVIASIGRCMVHHICTNNELVLAKDVRGKLLIIDFDDLFNTLNRICSNTNYCKECRLRRECEKTCGFTIVPEYWCIGGLIWTH